MFLPPSGGRVGYSPALGALTLTAFAIACLAGPARANEAPVASVAGPIGKALEIDAVSEGHDDTPRWLASSRVSLRQGTEWLARRVDGLFGDHPFEAGGQVANARLSLDTHWREDTGWDANTRLRAVFRLPNLRRQAYLFFGQDNARELVSETPEAFTRQQRMLAERRPSEQAGFAGLGLGLGERIDLRAGLKGGFDPYAQARYRREWQGDTQALEFRETLFWENEQGFGSTTALAYRHALDKRHALLGNLAGTFSEHSRGLAWSANIVVERDLGPLRRLALEALVHGETDARHAVREYGLRASWRQAIHRDWLLGELSVGHFWPREDTDPARRRSWGAGLGVEMLF